LVEGHVEVGFDAVSGHREERGLQHPAVHLKEEEVRALSCQDHREPIPDPWPCTQKPTTKNSTKNKTRKEGRTNGRKEGRKDTRYTSEVFKQ
jgi:hypothetical protein